MLKNHHQPTPPIHSVAYLGFLILLSCVYSLGVHAAVRNPTVEYRVEFLPALQAADVTVTIPKSKWLKEVQFLPLAHQLGEISFSGELQKNGRLMRWLPPDTNAMLHYQVKLNLAKPNGGYDALVTDDWALLRGEDLFPSFKAKKGKSSEPNITIEFVLPPKWTSVNAGWQPLNATRFQLDSGGRALVRPPGWIIAGILGTRREFLDEGTLIISAPKGQDFRQMEALAFLNMLWPAMESAFLAIPKIILITGARDPMWRGGLSSPNSLYIHADRPLVSENGTSTVVHELTHVITGIHGDHNSDWIVEGLAEFYSVEILFRSKAFSSDRKQSIFSGLAEWGKQVKSLTTKTSSGPITARAAVLFNDLDKEIRKCTRDTKTIDDVVRVIMGNKSVRVEDLRAAYLSACGRPSQVLQSKLIGEN